MERAERAEQAASAGWPEQAVSAGWPEQAEQVRQVQQVQRAASVGPVERTGQDGAPPSRWVRAGLAVRERLPVWLQLRCGLERRGLIALTAVLALAAVLAVQHFWAGRTQPVRAPEVMREETVSEATSGGAFESASGGRPAGSSPGLPPSAEDSADGAGAGAGGAAGEEAAGIVVDVSGKVRSPGVHRLPPGSRVADALRAAGGVRPGADTKGLNRARLLMDGEQVVVGEPVAGAGAGTGASAGGGAVAGGGSAGAGGTAPAGPIGLNTATAEQLDGLPGVGPVLAQHIIDYRTEHGGFRSVDELREVNGIGDRRFADLQNLVRP